MGYGLGIEEGTRVLDGEGKGRWIPTGRLEPALDVSYKSSHVFSENTAVRSQSLRKAVVDYITSDPAKHLPLGEFDLLTDNKVTQLKHVADDSEWLVLRRMRKASQCCIKA